MNGQLMQAAALAYAARGWPVLALKPGEKVPLRLRGGYLPRPARARARARAREELMNTCATTQNPPRRWGGLRGVEA